LTFPRICGCVACNLEADVVIVYLDAFGEDFLTTVIEVRHTVTLHSTSVSTVFTQLNYLNTVRKHFNDLVEVNVGLVVTPAGIKDIIDFDGVGLGNHGEVVFGGDNRSKAVFFSLAVDVAGLAGDFIDQEGGTCGDGDGLITVGAVDGDGVGDGGTTLDDVFHIVDGNNLHFRPAAVKNFLRLFLTFFWGWKRVFGLTG
jgi:hypothetical protein